LTIKGVKALPDRVVFCLDALGAIAAGSLDMSFLDWLLNPTGLTPHGFCLSWSPGLVTMHAVSDLLIGLAYFSIPLAIAAFVRRRPDIRYGWVAYLFVAFILACGATHFLAILTLWVPAYGIEGIIKVVTAILSIVTAVILWPLIPKAAALPSAAELERRVAERTGELTAALAQRDLLLREVYHRVKNNLQMIDGLLIMQSRRMSDPEGRQAMQGLRDRVYALGLVHHQLMDSQDLKTFDIAPFLEELSNNLVDGGAGQDVTLSIKAIPLDVGLDFAIPLGLLVTELVTNSLKHAFPGGHGRIEVSLTRSEDGALVLVVSDDGQGYGEADGTSKARKPALGMNIIDGLVAQLKGTLDVRSQPGGTRSEIRIAAPVVG
jgi:two-component sensor histidine kinase